MFTYIMFVLGGAVPFELEWHYYIVPCNSRVTPRFFVGNGSLEEFEIPVWLRCVLSLAVGLMGAIILECHDC